MVTTARRLSSFCLLAGILSLSLPAIAADTTIPLGEGYAARIDAKGVVSVTFGEEVLVRQLFVGTWLDDDFSEQATAVRVTGWERDGMVMRSGLIPRSGPSDRYTVFARPTPPREDGLRDLMLTYVVETPRFPDMRAAVLARLPLDHYAETSVEIDREPVGEFPAELQDRHILAMNDDVHGFLVSDERRPLLFMGRQSPGQILIQDGRQWETSAYEVQFEMGPTRSQPESRRLIHLLISLRDPDEPVVGRIRPNRPPARENMPIAVPRYDLFQLTFDLWGRFDNPYAAEEVRVTGLFSEPNGRTRPIRGFFFQDFERTREDEHEVLTPVGPPQWAVRYTPTQTGRHSYYIRVETADGTVTTESGSFYATPSDEPGFVRIHEQNPKFFQYENGETFFAIGHNVGWSMSDTGSYEYDTYFRRMEHAGQNYTRVWMCSWDTGIEGPRLDNYRLDAAWRLDYILELARRRGIRVKLCLDNTMDYHPDEDKRQYFGYWAQNGGPCVETMDFFTHPEAKEAYRRRVEYVIARWGYSPTIMAWELWNEINYLAQSEEDREILVEWTAEMAAFIKEQTPYPHLVTTSLGHQIVWDEKWELEDIDFAAIHWYLPRPGDAEVPEEKDAVLAILRATEEIRGSGKPFHIAEYGYFNLPEVHRASEMDRHGIHLHNALWAGLFTGAAGTPANWWWREYIHPNNLYRIYASVAGFIRDIDLADPEWRRLGAPDGTDDPRIFGIKKADACALWIQRKGNHWYRRTGAGGDGPEPPIPLGSIRLRVPDVEPGKYRVTWWDTSEGEITSFPAYAVRRENDPTKFDLILEYETGAPDIAVKARRVR